MVAVFLLSCPSSILTTATLLLFSIFEVAFSTTGTGTSGDPIILTDTSSVRQSATCYTSQTVLCYVSFTPTRSFHGYVEARIQYDTEDSNNLPTAATYDALFCFSQSSECDYIGEMASLRNLALEKDYEAGTTVNFVFQSSSASPVILISSFYINDGATSCLNNGCGGQGSCSSINSILQCSCSSNYAGRGCEINAVGLWANSAFTLSVSIGNSRNFGFTVSDGTSVSSMFDQKSLTLVTQGDSNNKCFVSVMLANSQLQDSFVFSFKDGSFNLNDLFQSTTFSSNHIFSLLVFFDNSQSSTGQFVGMELQMADKSSSESTSEFIVYILVAFVGLLVVVVFFCCVYLVFRRNVIMAASQRQCELAHVNFQAENRKPRQKEAREAEKSFQMLFNDKVPVKFMSAKLLKQLKNDGTNIFESLKNKEVSSVQSEDQQHNGVCSICIMTIEVGNSYRKTMCNHYFHNECLEAWMKKQRSCPMCRAPHEKPDLEAFNNKQVEIHQILGKELNFEMFVNPVSDNKPQTRKPPLNSLSEPLNMLTQDTDKSAASRNQSQILNNSRQNLNQRHLK